jgi:hypothetical protein
MDRIRANFDELAFVRPEQHVWLASPEPGVERVLLDRVGDEVAVATSLVRYAPGSRFAAHEHTRGEEFLVLEGEFADETGGYPAGTYVRNPPGSAHAPFSKRGCVLFVKLRQFAADDLTPRVATIPTDTPAAGWRRDTLHRHRDEHVEIVRAAAGEEVRLNAAYHALELLVVGGRITWQIDAIHTFGRWGWLRTAPGHPLRIRIIEPSVLFVKTRVHHRATG